MTYTTVQGDMFDSISYKLLGSVKYTDDIMRMNPQYRDVYKFSAGIVLNIPDVEDKVKSDTLPPWKRVSG